VVEHACIIRIAPKFVLNCGNNSKSALLSAANQLQSALDDLCFFLFSSAGDITPSLPCCQSLTTSARLATFAAIGALGAPAHIPKRHACSARALAGCPTGLLGRALFFVASRSEGGVQHGDGKGR